jgi:antitoxin component of RelBE/YafQ-DinJ toxin-antitoxin module
MNTKDKGLRIRVDEELRNEFLAVCHAQDKTASQVLREFMREYVRRYRQAAQQDLFQSNGIELELE